MPQPQPLTLRAPQRSPRAAATPAVPPWTASDVGQTRVGILVASWVPVVFLVAVVALERYGRDIATAQREMLNLAFGASAIVALTVIARQAGHPGYPLVRRRLLLIALGAVTGLVVPMLLMVQRAVDHQMALMAALVLAGAFPTACSAVARTHDLFVLDQILRRIFTYAVVVASTGCAELFLLVALRNGLPSLGLEAIHIAIGNVALLLAVPLIQERVGRAIAGWISPKDYSRRQQLAGFSDALGGAQTIEGVRRALADALCHTVKPAHHHLYVEDKRGQLNPLKTSAADPAAPALPKDILDTMRAGRFLYRYRHDDGRSASTAAWWTPLGVDAFVPIFTGGVLHGVLALGPKRSDARYHADDFAFLRAAAAQAALGLTNARASAQLREMNATLERIVDERTAAERAANAELQGANSDLARSLDELRHAYSQLEENHACLLRADRLATLGRLTAGIAHEVNTPLSAVQNALRILRELGEEYASSIDDASVAAGDHRDIASEIITTARSAAEWADKAARFIRGTKAHGRTARTVAEPFAITDVIDEVRTLLIHRLRVAGCTLECRAQRPGITILGDRSAFAQVLINVVSNALDAYEDAHLTAVRILVTISQANDTVTVEVRDWAGGIPLQVLPRIFEELFTTKGAGRGTGLGLWISRAIIEKDFAGQLDVMSVPGEGSCFIATIPPAPAADAIAPSCQDAA